MCGQSPITAFIASGSGGGATIPDGVLQTASALSSTLQVVKDNLGNNSLIYISKLGNVFGSVAGTGNVFYRDNNLTAEFGTHNASVKLWSNTGNTGNIKFFEIEGGAGEYCDFLYNAISFGVGTITKNGALTIKGSGSNILSLRNSSNVEKIYVDNAGILFSPTIVSSVIYTNIISGQGAGTIYIGSTNIIFNNPIKFEGTTSAYPMLKRNGAEIYFRLADDSANCNIVASRITAIDGTSQIQNIRLSNINCNDNSVTAINIVETTGALRINNATNNAQVSIKGSGGNIASFRDSSNVEKVTIDNSGNIVCANLTIQNKITLSNNSDYIQGSNDSGLTTIYSNQNIQMFTGGTFNYRFLSTGVLQLGGSTSSFPAIKRRAEIIEFRLADDSGYTGISTGCGANLSFQTNCLSSSPAIGFFGVSTINKVDTTIAEASFVHSGAGTNIATGDTIGGYTMQQVVQALVNYGLLS